MTVSRTRPLLLLALLFTLAASPAAAAPSGERPLLNRVWGLLSALWADVGCSIDPHGGCTSASAPPAEVGCSIDPSGACGGAAPSPRDVGCSIDPDGRCRE